MLVTDAAEHVHDLRPRLLVEAARRLVREDHARLHHERARERDALALAAGGVAGQLRDAADADRSRSSSARARAARPSPEPCRDQDVLERIERRDEVELEDEADRVRGNARG